MDDPLAQPRFAVLDIAHSDTQRLRGWSIQGKFDQLWGLIRRLAPEARKLSGEHGSLCLADQAPPHLVARDDMRIGENPLSLFVEIGRGGIGRCRLVANGALIDGDDAAVRLQRGEVAGSQFVEIAAIRKALLRDRLGAFLIERLDFKLEDGRAQTLFVERHRVAADRSPPAWIDPGGALNRTGCPGSVGNNKQGRDQQQKQRENDAFDHMTENPVDSFCAGSSASIGNLMSPHPDRMNFSYPHRVCRILRDWPGEGRASR